MIMASSVILRDILDGTATTSRIMASFIASKVSETMSVHPDFEVAPEKNSRGTNLCRLSTSKNLSTVASFSGLVEVGHAVYPFKC